LDAEARVRAANRLARRILTAREGLEVKNGRIVAARRDDAMALARFFERACPNVTVGGFHARGAMQIARSRQLPRLTVLVADAHGRPGAAASEFVLFLHQPDVPVYVCEATLRTLHGLTRMEARIAALLVGGRPVARIASEVGSSANTVRTHLKRVFAKLGVASQTALIRAVLSGPAALQLAPNAAAVVPRLPVANDTAARKLHQNDPR
jgi:DNA-binding CsgD family transcriptional regulator